MNQDKIWEYFQTSSPGIFDQSRSRLRYLAKLFPPGAKVLNIGIGGGVFEEEALRHGLEVYSLDPVESAVESVAVRFGLGDRAKQGACQDIPFPSDMFDGVILSEVLEHLEDDILSKALREVHRVLKPHGMLVGTVPAHEDISQNIAVCPECGHQFHRWGHVRVFDRHDLTNWLDRFFSHVVVLERKFVGRSNHRFVSVAAEILRRLFRVMGRRMFGTNYVFRAWK